MINFHPSDELLARYARADLSAGLSLAVATHLDYCSICRASVAEFEQAAADDLLELEAASEDMPAFDTMLDDILQSEPPEKTGKAIDKTQTSFIKVNEQKFVLPQTLSHFYSSDGRWRKFGGVHSNKLGAFDDFRSSLIYIEADTQVPKHTHKSLEITIVLAGDLCDEQGHYQPGDFIVLDNNVTHMPTTRPNQSCLCLAVMDAPVQFTQGAARLLNPFASLMY
ncbi:ChrR family anti-sigma-E factor [Catenovulum adriaticum]|uniref:ChrR family anti-sigma-E factor n=1 Tax=Catenovulum adriaticum TaxID=2984846 RepID=A0ABY7AKM7_9ALTE|nr:ChrR family anti-sigma-E factor [Catenovulum sp. TS8]WAJ69726.1 ChrR family anti-sigma-E factor [Catenovulum sp. TS8]